MARGEAPSKQKFDLNEAVREMVNLSGADLNQRAIAMGPATGAGSGAGLVRPSAVLQVLGNLLLNAMDACRKRRPCGGIAAGYPGLGPSSWWR